MCFIISESSGTVGLSLFDINGVSCCMKFAFVVVNAGYMDWIGLA